MRILHLALNCPFNEGWGYQENLLPKYQSKLGHTVLLVTTTLKNDGHGNFYNVDECDTFTSEGFRLIRLKSKENKIYKLLGYYNVKNIIFEFKPDIIMCHGLTNVSFLQAINYYKKNRDTVIIADNHLDEYNMPKYSFFKSIIIRFFWYFFNMIIQKYYNKVYGVTEGRIDFAHKYFGIKKNKLDLLPAGADSDFLAIENKNTIRYNIRYQNQISDEDFLIVTGGKIDSKKNIDKLIYAIKEMRDDVKLLFFGAVDKSLENQILPLVDNKKIKYIGWVDSQNVYDYFLSADLVCFPGLHSVLWEQACACGTPALLNDLKGLHHLDVGGNCIFVNGNDQYEIKKNILKIVNSKEIYNSMQRIAIEKAVDAFSYYELAKKTIIKNNL